MPTDISAKTRLFTESVIREMTRRALKCGAVNLAQGFPDFAAPAEIKEAAKRAIDEEYNQYAITHGSPNFRARDRRQGAQLQRHRVRPRS